MILKTFESCSRKNLEKDDRNKGSTGKKTVGARDTFISSNSGICSRNKTINYFEKGVKESELRENGEQSLRKFG